MIITGNHYFRNLEAVKGDAWEWFLTQARQGALRRGVNLRPALSDEPSIIYHVNDGAWKAKCPNLNCRGYEMAWEECFFICCSCLNAQAGHRLLRARFPIERREIEALLEIRPLPNRNWELLESLDDLRRDNKLHALELLVEAQ